MKGYIMYKYQYFISKSVEIKDKLQICNKSKTTIVFPKLGNNNMVFRKTYI